MSLAIFDLDNTLLAGDSDYLWGQFLVQQGVVDQHQYESKNQHFYDEYKLGKLDIFEFLGFSLAPLSQHDMPTLKKWHQQFMQDIIQPLISPAAIELVEKHRRQQHTLLIITATNHFVTAPIAKAFGIDNLLATDPEIKDGRYTGKVAGTPCFKEGKVTRLHAWLAETGFDLQESWFYSDSHNDLPLLQQVTYPFAVNPDDTLRDYAQRHDWPILKLHNEHAER